MIIWSSLPVKRWSGRPLEIILMKKITTRETTLVSAKTRAPIGAWKCKFPHFYVIMTDRQTDRPGHREVMHTFLTLPFNLDWWYPCVCLFPFYLISFQEMYSLGQQCIQNMIPFLISQYFLHSLSFSIYLSIYLLLNLSLSFPLSHSVFYEWNRDGKQGAWINLLNKK